MVRHPKRTNYGRIIDCAPKLSLAEIAIGVRVPISVLGQVLRRLPRELAVHPTQARVLSQVSAGDVLTVSELAQGQGIAVSTMTEVVARLAEQGLLSKSTTNADRREVRVAITELGLDRLDRTLEERNRILGERLAVLTEGEQRSIAAAIPALWKLAAIDAAEWPRVPLKPDGKKRRADRNTAGS